VKLYKYKNYSEYVKCQRAACKKKFKNVWAQEENIKAIAEYLNSFSPKKGLCHGTRQGWEQKWFMKYLPFCIVIGSEIGRTDDLNTIQWDFNIQNPDWIGKFDFIYSNSFDHAFNPELTFNIWCEQLKPNGLIILEYDRRQEHTGEISKGPNKVDPVSITVRELYDKIRDWNPNATIIDILDMPVVTQEWRKAIIIQVRR
jgi:SAM-dependent methyltransferase